jgi:hypothetical protein
VKDILSASAGQATAKQALYGGFSHPVTCPISFIMISSKFSKLGYSSTE